MITIVAEFEIKPQKSEEFIKAAIDLTRETRKERGCLSYKILQSEKNENSYTFIEEWLNDAAIEAHNNSKYFGAFLEKINDLTAADINIERFVKVPSVFF